MNEERDEESLIDLLTNWEQLCAQHLESEPDYEGQLQNERDLASQKAWYCFQNTASSIAQLYKDRLQDVSSLWFPFQTAAGTVATLYKESSEAIRRTGDTGVQCGYQRRTRELLSWARKKRRHIRREDLISYLAGKPLPPRTTSVLHSHRMPSRPCLLVAERHHAPMVSHHSSGGHDLHLSSAASVGGIDESLHMFREALAISGGAARRSRSSELSSFVSGELARHCTAVKRAAPPSTSPPPHDINMDSPTHPKKQRFM